MSTKRTYAALGAPALIGGLAACGSSPSSTPGAGSLGAIGQTPQQQLTAELMGSTSSTDATVTSATVGAMCSASNGEVTRVYDPYGTDPGQDASYINQCASTGGRFEWADGVVIVPISQWQKPGISTSANGEVFLSDGTQDVVIIQVDSKGNITWTAWPS
jgi:hypothetical protein